MGPPAEWTNERVREPPMMHGINIPSDPSKLRFRFTAKEEGMRFFVCYLEPPFENHNGKWATVMRVVAHKRVGTIVQVLLDSEDDDDKENEKGKDKLLGMRPENLLPDPFELDDRDQILNILDTCAYDWSCTLAIRCVKRLHQRNLDEWGVSATYTAKRSREVAEELVAMWQVVRRYFDFEDERTALGVPQPDRVKRPSSRLVRHVQQEFEYAMVWPGGLSFSDLYAVAAKAAGSDAVHVHSYTLYEGFPMLMWMPGVKDGWPGLSLKSKYTRM